ncbi:hypothetical protein AVEN_254506-1 [Araneus ventricosus]|uniref:Uncharacterized protein n=1 Tax=Araneus ventricosus TaxID=182803 RepID=A0A4Y2RL77_ARAVE|nr:hypothetical protein AVEN_254506-1 [Araneus ventricosus]
MEDPGFSEFPGGGPLLSIGNGVITDPHQWVSSRLEGDCPLRLQSEWPCLWTCLQESLRLQLEWPCLWTCLQESLRFPVLNTMSLDLSRSFLGRQEWTSAVCVPDRNRVSDMSCRSRCVCSRRSRSLEVLAVVTIACSERRVFESPAGVVALCE